MTVVRVDFIFNGYLKSVKGFIKEYHEMIHRAAGYHALRMHLLVRADHYLPNAHVLSRGVFHRYCRETAS